MDKTKESIIVIGVNESKFLKQGWHDRFRDQQFGIDYRPTEKIAIFTIMKQPHHKKLILVVNAAVNTIHKAFKTSIRVNRELLGNFLITSEGWDVKEFDIRRFPNGMLNAEIKNHVTFIPDTYVKNGDYRELGVYISAIRLR